MTAPRTFTEYVDTLPNPRADRWDALVAGGMSHEDATRQVLREFDAPRARAPKTSEPSLALPFAQGVTFGFADEGLAGLSTLQDKWAGDGRTLREIYAARVREERDRLQQVRDAHPVLSVGAELAGGLLTGGGLARAGAKALGTGAVRLGTSLGGRVATGALSGAAAGGVAGYGTAEGSTADQLASAVDGATYGGFAGGALPLIGAGIRHLRDAIGVRARGAVIPSDAPVAPASVRDRIARIATRATGATSADRADTKIVEALTANGQTLDDVMARAEQAIARKAPVALVDVGGKRMQRLARGARTGTGGEVLDAMLERRTAGASDRFVSALDDVTGTQRGIPQELEEMITRQRAQADALYPTARAAGLEVRPDNAAQVDTLRRVLTKPKFRQAFAAAQELADDMDDPIADIFTTNADGTVTLTTIPDVRTLDYIKRGVQAVIEKGNGGAGLASDAANNLRKQLRDVLSVYDELVPEYRAARQAFAGEAELRDAYTAAVDGATRRLSADRKLPPFLQASADDVRYAVGQMTEGEREAYRLGAIAAMRRSEQNIADSGDRVKRLFGTPAMRAKLRAIFPDDDTFAQFETRMGDEATMRGSADFLRGGSNTAEKLVDAGEAGGLSGVMTLLGRAVADPVGAITQVGQATARRAVQGQSPIIAEAIARRAALGPDDTQALLRYLRQLRAQQLRAATAGVRGTAGTGAAAGSMAGGMAGRP
jgi:hypothetical protein